MSTGYRERASSRCRFPILAVLLAMLCQALPAQEGATDLGPGVHSALNNSRRIATAAGVITSTAISPLLGVCLFGAYEYLRTPWAGRARLPLYTSPWFWIPVSVLLVLIFLKDTIGGSVPLLKKPLDALEVLLVNKAALVLAVFPMVFHEAAKYFGLESAPALLAAILRGVEPVVHAATPGAGQNVSSVVDAALVTFSVAFGLIIGFVVWLVSHAIDVLTLLSPFPLLDLLLKTIRTAIFVLLATLTFLDPRVALGVSVIVIAICLFLAGWAFRLAVFGAILSWDLISVLVMGASSRPKDGESIGCFTARKFGRARKRTYGKLQRDANGALGFQYRPWLFGPRLTVPLEDPAQYEIARGIFYPCVLHKTKAPGKYKLAFRVLPRYLRSEEQLASVLGLSGARDLRRGRGLRAFREWLADDSSEPSAETSTA